MFDAFFPVVGELLVVFWILVGVDDGSGGGDECAGAIGFAELHAVFGGGALSAVTGDKEKGVGVFVSEGFGIFRGGAAYDHADIAVAAVADPVGFVGDRSDLFGEEFVEFFSVGVGEIGEDGGGGVAGSDPDEDALMLFMGEVGEGGDGVEAGEGVDGDGVGGLVFGGIEGGVVGEMALGVGAGGGADVAPFDVSDDQESEMGGFLDEGVVGFDAFEVVFFEEGGVELDGGDEGGDDPQDFDAELEEGIGGGFDVDGCVGVVSLGERFGEFFVNRVDADDGGCSFDVCGVCEFQKKETFLTPNMPKNFLFHENNFLRKCQARESVSNPKNTGQKR